MSTLLHHLGSRAFNYSDDIKFSIEQNTVDELIALLQKWAQQSSMRSELNYSQKKFGVPSLFVRFDGVLHDGHFFVYEIESSPAGLGYAGLISAAFREKRDTAAGKLPSDIGLVLGPLRKDHDDRLW